jgi:hypothetical protein
MNQQTDSRRTRSTQVPDWGFGLLAFAIALAHFASFDPFDSPVDRDLRYFLYFAWQITEGATPYLDLFDPKMPLASFAGALLWTLGEGLGVEPIHAVRVGYLGLAAAGGWLAFLVFRALGGGRPVAGFLGLAAYLSFGLLGDLPALGNVPKLLMALGASATALLCLRQRWLAAGVTGAIAFLDWQLGALVWLGAFAAALLYGRPGHRAALRTVVGGALGIAPCIAFFVARGALGVAFEQTVVSAFFRGATSGAQQSFGDHLARVVRVLERTTDAQSWLCLAAIGGAGVVLTWLWRRRAHDSARLLVSLCLYHFGIILFCLVDFQYLGDAFAALHSFAFFVGALWVALYLRAEAWATRRWPARAGAVTAAVALVVAFAVARPGPTRPQARWNAHEPSFSEQREVAVQLEELLAGRELAVVEVSEMLLLMRRKNPLPFIYWNAASWRTYRRSETEGPRESLRRLLDATEADVRILQPRPGPPIPRRFPLYGLSGADAPGPEWIPVELRARSGRYRVVVHVRGD